MVEPIRANISQSPTITPTMTQPGMILGTAAYMSPEQARGMAVDKRTDVWAFGCVLYGMLAGRQAFARDTVSDTLVAVLEHDPDWSHLPAGTPLPIQKLLHRCLEKDQKRRRPMPISSRVSSTRRQATLVWTPTPARGQPALP